MLELLPESVRWKVRQVLVDYQSGRIDKARTLELLTCYGISRQAASEFLEYPIRQEGVIEPCESVGQHRPVMMRYMAQVKPENVIACNHEHTKRDRRPAWVKKFHRLAFIYLALERGKITEAQAKRYRKAINGLGR